MKIKLTILVFVFGMTIAMLAGCGGNKYEPAAIQEDADKCDICNMQVKDDAFATQLITEEGKVYKFDDIGCMNEWKKKNGAEGIAIEFVRDHESNEWVKLDNAYFAYDPSFKSPMAYGLISFKDKEAAERFIDDQGKGVLLSASDLAGHTWARDKGSMHMKMDKMHEENAHEETEMKGSHS